MMTDACPARVEPLPPGVPTRRQLRGHITGDTLTVAWLDDGARHSPVRLPAAGYRVRQAGCRCVGGLTPVNSM